MFRSFREIEESVLAFERKPRLVIANAQDLDALSAVVHAKNKGVIEPILIGDTAKIADILTQLNEDPRSYPMREIIGEKEAAAAAMEMVVNGEADIPMKGLMQTASFMRALLNKAYGFASPSALLSQATVLEWPEKEKLMVISDCAINIAPDLSDKKKILRNAVALSHKLGFEKPNVAVVSAVETVRDKIPSTVEANTLAQMSWEDCVVGGPFALDNAVSEEAVRHKGINHPAAGKADVLIMPNLCTGNVFTKSLTFFAHLPSAGVVCGTSIPVVMTSRTDMPENKYYSILTAIVQKLV